VDDHDVSLLPRESRARAERERPEAGAYRL
jgi:hypothetical protein